MRCRLTCSDTELERNDGNTTTNTGNEHILSFLYSRFREDGPKAVRADVSVTPPAVMISAKLTSRL